MSTIKIHIDNSSGFCFGVVKAIEAAEKHIQQGDVLYCLGNIVHNGKEVGRLTQMGMKTISHAEIENIKGQKLMIRAHGEPPSTYFVAENNNIRLIDATCPVVLKLQKRIHQSYIDLKDKNGQVVIYGRKGHAEVNGLVGQTNYAAIVIEDKNDIEGLNFSLPIHLYAQTTKSIEGFKVISDTILKRVKPGVEFRAFDTICRQVANRMPKIEAFARNYDLILFVSGKESSNGKMLYKGCKIANKNSFFITKAEEIDPKWINSSITSIGICGATSTPRWLMEEVAAHLKLMINYS